MNTYTEFSNKQIDAAYINALVDLVVACRNYGVNIDKVEHSQNGWRVTFEGHEDADAICHDGSYGSPNYMAHMNGHTYRNDWSITGPWETFGFDWDGDDVSVHDADELTFYLRCLNEGVAPWRTNKEEEEPDIPDEVDESNYDPYCGCDIFDAIDEVW